MFFDDLDIMKLYSFGGGFHFRKYEHISWCIFRGIRRVAVNHYVMVLQEVLNCNSRVSRGTVAQNEATAVLQKLQPLSWHLLHYLSAPVCRIHCELLFLQAQIFVDHAPCNTKKMVNTIFILSFCKSNLSCGKVMYI